MKVKVENIPAGIMVCYVSSALERSEITTMIQGIEKVLANGKARIVLSFSPKAVTDKIGIKLLEKGLRTHQTLARKMGGDIIYVVPETFMGQLPNSVSDLPSAVTLILKRADSLAKIGPEKAQEKSEVDPVQRLKMLELENKALTSKVKELLEIVAKPSTHEELQQAVEYYRSLAMQTELKPVGEAQPSKS